MAIRNGRFKRARTIIAGRADTFFRILNSAEFDNSNVNTNAFTVEFGPGNNSSLVLPTFSLDFFARGDVSVIAGTGLVEGMYEALPNAEFKNGRFKTKQPMNPTVGVPIVISTSGSASAIYRIFNSGPTPLQLFTRNPGGGGETDLGPVLLEDDSYDFVTVANKIILVKGTLTANDHIEGIYDFIARV